MRKSKLSIGVKSVSPNLYEVNFVTSQVLKHGTTNCAGTSDRVVYTLYVAVNIFLGIEPLITHVTIESSQSYKIKDACATLRMLEKFFWTEPYVLPILNQIK